MGQLGRKEAGTKRSHCARRTSPDPNRSAANGNALHLTPKQQPSAQLKRLVSKYCWRQALYGIAFSCSGVPTSRKDYVSL